MTHHVEVNDPVDCDIYIGSAPVAPAAHQARTCPQCKQSTWTNTAACMWCGHDRLAKPLRWLLVVACLGLLLVNIPLNH